MYYTKYYLPLPQFDINANLNAAKRINQQRPKLSSCCCRALEKNEPLN